MTAYLRAQTTIATNLISRIPGRARLQKSIAGFDAPGVSIKAVTPDGDTLYYLRQGVNDDVAKLVERQASGGDENVLIDPEGIPGVRPHSEIDQFVPAVDGTFVVFGMEYAGPDTSALRIYDTIRHTLLSERIDGARFAQVSWLPDSAGFYYTHAIAPDAVAPVQPGAALPSGSVTQQSASVPSGAAQSSRSQPDAQQSGSGQPNTFHPNAAQPGLPDPRSARSGSAQAGSAQPGLADSDAARPGSTQPDGAQPRASNPAPNKPDAVRPFAPAAGTAVALPAKPLARGWGHLGVFLHLLGHDPATDQLVLDGAKLPFPFTGTSAFPRLLITPGSGMALAIVSDGASPNLTIATVPLAQVREQPAPWQLVAAQADGVTQIVVNDAIAFLLTSSNADKMRVVSEDLANPGFEQARTIIPESAPGNDGVITGIAAGHDALYVARRQGGAMHLLRLDLNQTVPDDVPLPFAGTIAPVFGSGTAREWGGLAADPRVPGAYFSLESWSHPLTWMRYDLAVHRVLDMLLLPDRKIDSKAYETQQITAPATDGTPIPLTVIARRGVAMDHARPTLVSAFGSFGYAFDPRFMPMALAWADQGGVFAIAHVRGGGELGESWHQAGTNARKVTAATDMLACASALVHAGYTSSDHLAGMGTNAGALAIGNAITLQPGLFHAALIRAGLNNPLRTQAQPGHDGDILELGDAAIPLQQAAILSIDPYAQVKDGLPYPAVLLTASVNDMHEPVWETAKMAARLQSATSSGRPVLMRIAFDEGRDGPTRAQRDANEADEMTFLLWQLGAPGFQPGTAPAVMRRARRGRGR